MAHACRCGFELCIAIGSFHEDKDGLRVCWRNELLEAVSIDPFLLKGHLSKVAQDGVTLSQAARGLSKFFETIGRGRENDSFAADLAVAAMKFDASVYHALPARLGCRPDIAAAAVKGDVSIYGGLQAPLSTDPDVLCAVLQAHPDFAGSVTSSTTQEEVASSSPRRKAAAGKMSIETRASKLEKIAESRTNATQEQKDAFKIVNMKAMADKKDKEAAEQMQRLQAGTMTPEERFRIVKNGKSRSKYQSKNSSASSSNALDDVYKAVQAIYADQPSLVQSDLKSYKASHAVALVPV
jgi:hypothetical protein